MTTELIDLMSRMAALEPLSAASLAITLAYLALDRFRYRDKIQAQAAEKLNDDSLTGPAVHHTTAFGALIWLAGSEAPQACVIACDAAISNGTPKKNKAPAGFKATSYDWLFRVAIGEGVVAFLSGISFIVLVAAVAVQSQVMVWLPTTLLWFFPLGVYFAALLAGSILPVLLVWLGRACVKWAENHTHEMGEEMKATAQKMQGAVQDLPAPDLAPN